MKIVGYAVCFDNAGYTVSLELRKIYPITEPYPNDPKGYLRIFDESGEDYLYSEKAFAFLDLSPNIKKQLEESLALT